jgi:hypothetical protein
VKLPDLPQQVWTAISPQHPPSVHTPPSKHTQRDTDSADKDISFGRPKLLSNVDEVVPSSSPTSPPASSPLSGSNLPPSSLSAHPSLVLSCHSTEKAPIPGSFDTDDEEANTRVPSSNTPSPLKLPSDQSDPAARALHESISNLLGKRNAGAMAVEDLVEPPPRRKRARPRFKASNSLCCFHARHVITCLCGHSCSRTLLVRVRTPAQMFLA